MTGPESSKDTDLAARRAGLEQKVGKGFVDALEQLAHSLTDEQANELQMIAELMEGDEAFEQGTEHFNQHRYEEASQKWMRTAAAYATALYVAPMKDLGAEERKGYEDTLSVALNNIVLCFRRMNQLPRALSLLQAAREKAPKAAPVLLQLGIVCRDLGQHPESFEALSAANKLAPDNEQVAKEYAAAQSRQRVILPK